MEVGSGNCNNLTNITRGSVATNGTEAEDDADTLSAADRIPPVAKERISILARLGWR